MKEKLFATFDRAHVRLYRIRKGGPKESAALELLDSVDMPEGRATYTESETDQAGRFPRSRGLAGGMGIDERLPMKREHDKRVAAMIAHWLALAIRRHPAATWECAAGPELLHAVLSQLEPDVRTRLEREIQKNVAHLPEEELRAHVFQKPA